MGPSIGFEYIVACHLSGAPSYGGVRTWVEGSQTRGTIKLSTNNAECTPYSILVIIGKLTGVGRDNIHCTHQTVLQNETEYLCE